MQKISASLALVAAAVMAGAKVLLAEDLWWPFVIVEYLAAALLTLGAITALRGDGVGVLTGGWGFTAGLTWSTLFHHLQAGRSGPLEFALGALLVTAAVGFALAAMAGGVPRIGARMSALAVMFVVGGAIAATTPAAAQGVSLGGRWATQGFGSIVDMQPCTGYPTAVCGRIVWLREAVEASGRPRRWAQSKSRLAAAPTHRRRDYSRISRDVARRMDRWAPVQSG